MSTHMTQASTFGNWRRQRSAGLGPLGFVGTVIAFVVLGLAVLLSLASLWASGVVVLIGLFVLAPLVSVRHGRNGFQRAAATLTWWWGKRTRSVVYRSGVLGRLPHTQHTLPGVAAPTRCYEAQDAFGRPFGMIYVPYTGHYSAVLHCDADGAALVDQDQIERWVASWGSWLALLGHEPNLAACTVTVETSPDPGHRLAQEVRRQVRPDAPELARQMMQEIADTFPRGSATVTTRIQLTYKATTAAGRRDAEAMAVELGTRIPALAEGLASTGAGVATPMTVSELAETLRGAYDPAAAAVIEQARLDSEGSGLTWDSAGPVATENHWDSYRHDSGTSVTWEMVDAPRGTVFSNILGRLLAPHPRLSRKRVTLVYRPFDPAAATARVEADVTNATFAANQEKPAKARTLSDLRAATQAAMEEASGAGLERFSLLVTATVLDAADLVRVVPEIENLGAGARLRLRRCYGNQDAAFAAGLPTGIVLPDHVRTPVFLREAI
ncbi:hypothetical protein NUM3379_35280 [Kineococcus sp. NUM-3379]